MPVIECMIKREGPTTIDLDKTRYLFMPVPFAKRGRPSTSICDINKEEHLNFLFGKNKNGEQIRKHPQFRIYDPEESRKLNEDPGDPLEGFSIQKNGEPGTGYLVVDKRGKQKRYAGPGGWSDKPVVAPFQSEIDAHQWLTAELEMEGMEQAEAKGKKG